MTTPTHDDRARAARVAVRAAALERTSLSDILDLDEVYAFLTAQATEDEAAHVAHMAISGLRIHRDRVQRSLAWMMGSAGAGLLPAQPALVIVRREHTALLASIAELESAMADGAAEQLLMHHIGEGSQ